MPRPKLPRPVPYDLEAMSAAVDALGPTPSRYRTLAEWQYAADLAELALAVDAARMFGLIEGGPEVNAGRASVIIEQAARRGVTPAPSDDLLGQFLAALMAPPIDETGDGART